MSEEIIIDGIDVSECEYIADTIPPDCENNTCFCYEDKDCYYKQLKRLQKENEELKARFNELYNNAEQLANKYNKYGGNKESELVEIINKTTDERNKYKQTLEEIRDILCNGRTFYEGYFDSPILSRTDAAIKVINEVLK